MRSFWRYLFRPSAIRVDAMKVLRDRGLSEAEASEVYSAIRFSARTGTPYPPHVVELLERSR